MAAKTDGETNGCTFLWKIGNISHCWSQKGKAIQSPNFTVHALEGTKWSLLLYPVGYNENDVELRLYRLKDCSGPDKVLVNVKLAFLDKGDSSLKELILKSRYCKDSVGICLIEKRKKVFLIDREAFLPDDTLTVQCTIWKINETPVKPTDFFARTVWKVQRRYFVWKIEKFSSRQPGIRNKFKDDLVEFELVLKEGLDSEKNLVIGGLSFDKRLKYFLFRIAVVNWKGQKEYHGSQEYFEADLKNGILSTLLSTKMVLENKRRYLINDILSLDCECLYSTGDIEDQFCSNGLIYHDVTKVINEEMKEHFAEQPNTHQIPVLVNDLKSMYNDGIFSDMKLRTSTQTFPAHKAILSARSPVFRRMFSNDMKENSTGHIDISDLEEETVRQMLLFIYTDSLEGLQFDNACKLYVAADKYEILYLRSRCSSFLKDNLCSDNACDILVLADRHQDEDLKIVVQDFILSHTEIFGSLEWKHLMATNIQLAADVMYQRIYPG